MSNILRHIPDELYTDFFFDDSAPYSLNWTNDFIQSFIDTLTPINIINNNTKGMENYTNGALFNLIGIMKYKSYIENKNIAVIGSYTPWLEATILNMNAKSVTTVEYKKPQNNDLIKTITYEDFCNSDEKYDAIFSYSSIEHSGLGRYGDKLNPNGDIETMLHIHKHLSDDGLAFIGIPIGKDLLCWNAHRIYGNIRLPLLLNNFIELEWVGAPKSYLDFDYNNIHANNQPVIILKKA
jgi:hypothetical protein